MDRPAGGLTDGLADGLTDGRTHNGMTIARWPMASGANKITNQCINILCKRYVIEQYYESFAHCVDTDFSPVKCDIISVCDT